MSQNATDYFMAHVGGLFEKIASTSVPSIDQAAGLLVDVIERDGIIHVGAAGGHSQIPAMEMFYRAGGLANVSIMFGCGLGLFDARPCLERVEGMGRLTMAYYDVRPRDAVIIVSYYGINAATIDLALAARERKAALIGITSTAFGEQTTADFPARHSSRKNLADIVDVLIDTHSDPAEQLIAIPGAPQPVGVASTLAGCLVVQLLVIKTVEQAVARGIEPPLWMCANVPEGDETNLALLRRYTPRIRHIYPESADYIGE
jgi:uncharacterized phosphosugar-binding protein